MDTDVVTVMMDIGRRFKTIVVSASFRNFKFNCIQLS